MLLSTQMTCLFETITLTHLAVSSICLYIPNIHVQLSLLDSDF